MASFNHHVTLHWRVKEYTKFYQNIKSINSLALSFLYSLSHPYMTTGKTIALTKWAFVRKVISMMFEVV